MNNEDLASTSRRIFLKRTSCLTAAAAAVPWMLSLAASANANAGSAAGYKALVCIYLAGGNDYANTLVPYDLDNHGLYEQFRPAFAYSRDRLAATLLLPLTTPVDAGGYSHQYALAPGLAPLLPLFDAGQLAVLLNVGPLVQPTTKLQFVNKTVPLPPKLTSHNDQQSVWQSSWPEGANSGWGGRLGDLFYLENSMPTFTCVNVASNAVFLAGGSSVQYQVSSKGSVAINGLKSPLFGSPACSAALRHVISQPSVHLLENAYSKISSRAIDAHEVLTSALAAVPPLKTIFPAGNSLADQLQMVARIIAAAPVLGAKRQVFYVTLGGFDNHDNMLINHPLLMEKLGSALVAFHAATAELDVADTVTTFTASEFGRTMVGNASGTDHGWGSMHFVMGGAVKGQRFYGTAPIVANGGPDDIGQGRLLPTTSVDQFAATMGAWFGASDSDLVEVFPNLANFNASDRKLGFV